MHQHPERLARRFFFSSRRRHTRLQGDWSSDVCSSDLELGYEAVGDVDARLETVADWKEKFREGVVYYLKDGRVRGVLLWNTWGQVDHARALIAEPGPFKPQELKGRLPA